MSPFWQTMSAAAWKKRDVMNDALSQCQWLTPPATLSLGEGEVHVWRAQLGREASTVSELLQILSEDERLKAGRLCVGEVRERFIVGRSVLRGILGQYLHVRPEQLRFSYGPHGKPAIAPECEGGGIRFNMSDSSGLAVFAVTRGREIGIDLERMRPDVPCEELARRYFAAAEVSEFLGLPESQRQEGFFNCWTRKEAYLKAIGRGLSFPLRNVVVSLAPGKPATILAIEGDPEEARRWSLTSLNPDPAYSAALVVEGRECRVTFLNWDGY